MESEPTRDDWIYFAGLFDGEGCISARVQHSGGNHVTVGVASTHMDTMRWVHAKFGGGTEVMRAYRVNHREKLRVRWTKASECLRILVGIRPFLRIKAEEAELGIALCDVMVRNAGKKNIPAEEREWRHGVVTRLHLLKRKCG